MAKVKAATARTALKAKTSATSNKAPAKKAATPAAKKVVPAGTDLMKKAIEQKLTANTDQQNNGADTKAKSNAVDSHVPGGQSVYKVVEEAGVVYSCYLMWTDTRSNKNKYFILQVLERKAQFGPHTNYYLWTRYGRVGYSGVTSLEVKAKDSCMREYSKKSRAKQSKGYKEILMALGDTEGKAGGDINQAKPKFETQKYADSKLDPKVADLVKFIFDKNLMEAAVVKVGFDVKKMPLGELSNETVLEGYRILTKIEKIVKKEAIGDLNRLSSDFYTVIPHNFGMKKMSNFVINNEEKLKEKLELIQNLIDIQVAEEVVTRGRKKREEKKVEDDTPKENPIDSNFAQLKCTMKPLQKEDEAYKMINTYLENGKGGSYQRFELLDCFEIERENEAKIFNPKKLGNRTLLWHGSRFSNFPGILSQGMRIAPPEAPKTGYLFGKGVYFADLIGKSHPYARPGLSNGIATFVLCEVALGNTRQLTRPDCDADNLPVNTHSTHAVGNQRPDPKSTITFDKDVQVPLGKPQAVPGAYMGANEFVVYNTNQIKMRYLVRTKNI